MKAFILGLTLACCLAVLTDLADAGEFRSGGDVTVAAADTVSADLYVGTGELTIHGAVIGDLLAGAQNITIDGHVADDVSVGCQRMFVKGGVDGDLTAAAQVVVIDGKVGGSVRVFCGELHVNGEVDGDVIGFAGQVRINEGAVVNGDVIAYAGRVRIHGTVTGRVMGEVGRAMISGHILHDVDLGIGERLEVYGDAQVDGSLTYRSAKPFNVETPEAVAGGITHVQKDPEGDSDVGFPFKIWSFFAAFIVGIVVLALRPGEFGEVVEEIQSATGRSLGIGALALLVTPILVVLCMVLVLTIPLGVILVVAFGVLFYVAQTFVGAWVGRMIFQSMGQHQVSRYAELVLGLLIAHIFFNLPWIGFLAYLIVAVLGMGATISTLRKTPA